MSIWKSAKTTSELQTGSVIDTDYRDTGFVNHYLDYRSQVDESWRKYRGQAEWGNSQVQSLINLLTAFTSGQGASISSGNETFKRWVDAFLRFNRNSMGSLHNIVSSAHLSGKAVVELKVKEYSRPYRKGVYMKLWEYNNDTKYKLQYKNPYDKDIQEGFYLYPGSNVFKRNDVDENFLALSGVTEDETFQDKKLDSMENHLHYLRFGKPKLNEELPDLGSVLTECENYDRAIKALRKLNHYGANITPYWKCQDQNEVAALSNALKKENWQIGKGFVGTAELSYVSTKNNTAHDGIIKEIEQIAMRMTSQTGIPVHYLGFVALMSNRSTADSLWDLVSSSTAIHRDSLADFMYTLLIDAQQMYIDNAIDFSYTDPGTKKRKVARLTELTTDFDICYPVVDYQNFINLMKGLSIAFNDGIIDSDEYRKHMPEVDPSKKGPVNDIYTKTEQLAELSAKNTHPREIDQSITPDNLSSKVNR